LIQQLPGDICKHYYVYSKIVNIKFVRDDAGMSGLVSFKSNSGQKGKENSKPFLHGWTRTKKRGAVFRTPAAIFLQTSPSPRQGSMEDIPNVP
jgi:hypothetical protein